MAKSNSATARLTALRSVAARKAAEAERVANAVSIPLPAILPADQDPLLAARILSVRRQLTRLDDLLEREKDPAKLDRLASAQFRLSETERILCNRPLPGSRRPGRELERDRSSQAWLDAVPVPAVCQPSG